MIKFRQVPVIKSLSVDKILEFAEDVCDIKSYMPDLKKKLPSRSFVCTVGMVTSILTI